MKKFLSLIFVIVLFASLAQAQTAEVTIQLNEQFFDALLDGIFKNAGPPEFSLASKREDEKARKRDAQIVSSYESDFLLARASLIENQKPKTKDQNLPCKESIRLQREIDGVRTAVRFREGKIYAPLAFAGNYNPPLVGCIGFSGWAETNLALEFDREKQTLFGRALVSNVNLSGAGGIGSGVLTKLVQTALDKKLNPIQILQTEKVSFVIPLQNAGGVKMKAVGMRHEIANGILNLHIAYEFQKAP